MGLLRHLKSLFGIHHNDFQTFTYFLPAPPSRKSGYREKNFDNLIKELNQLGFEIVDIKTQSIDHNDQPGLWVIVSMRALTKEAKALSPSEFPIEFSSNNSMTDITSGTSTGPSPSNEKTIDLPPADDHAEEVKGIYYID